MLYLCVLIMFNNVLLYCIIAVFTLHYKGCNVYR